MTGGAGSRGLFSAVHGAAVRCSELSGVTPRSVLRGLRAYEGLVVLSGQWGGGGVVIARDPIDTTSDPARLTGARPHGATATSEGIGGGWFGWLTYPQAGQQRPHWFGLYPNVLRYSAKERVWLDEAITGLAETDELDRRRKALVSEIAACARRGRSAHRRPEYRASALRPNMSAGEYTAAVERCVDRIRAGDIYQANICMRLDGEFHGDVASAFADLVDRLEPAYAALVCTADAAVVSMSPELFLRRNGNIVSSAPIKGTRPRRTGTGDAAQAEALRRSDKERAENVMIVDLVRNDLAQVAETGSVSVPSLLTVEPHCGVWQLVSRVSARLAEGVGDEAMIAAAYPPGSVTGAPKRAARQVIDEIECAPRGVYTGAIGYFSPASTELNVAIRTLEVRGPSSGPRQAHLGVGAGITASSTPVLEWWECLDKATPLADAMGAAIVTGRPRQLPDDESTRAGVRETMLVLGGRVVALEEHLGRLAKSLSELWDVGLPPSTRAEIAESVARAPGPVARLRVDVTRHGSASRVTAHTSRQMRPAPMACQHGLRLPLTILADGLGRHKWSDTTVVQTMEVRNRGQQIMIVDPEGRCLESTRGNILVFRGTSVVTPPLDGRIVPGVTRRAVLDLSSRHGLDVHVREVWIDELESSDGMAVCGSLGGMEWVRWCPAGAWSALCVKIK